MLVRFIGDVHGKMSKYMDIVSGCSNSIQLGDFGAGFVNLPTVGENHRFIRGNHDNPSVCRNSKNWIPDGTIENNVIFIGGAYSIDKDYRTPEVDWWEDEELSYNSLSDILETVLEVRPSVIISHTCPDAAARSLFKCKNFASSRTSNMFNILFANYQPNLWIFGHWHQTREDVVNGTKFVCLGECAYKDIEI